MRFIKHLKKPPLPSRIMRSDWGLWAGAGEPGISAVLVCAGRSCAYIPPHVVLVSTLCDRYILFDVDFFFVFYIIIDYIPHTLFHVPVTIL